MGELRRSTVIAVVALLCVAAALGIVLALRTGSSPSSTTTPAPTSSTISPSATAVGPAADAAEAACATELQTLRTAVETFTAVNGASPTDEASIVSAGLLEEPSVNYDVSLVNGSAVVVLHPGSNCSAP